MSIIFVAQVFVAELGASAIEHGSTAGAASAAVGCCSQLGATGPPQHGRGSNGQYVYWITMALPTAAIVAAHGVKTPREFDRAKFIALSIQVHRNCEVHLEEVVCFQQPHEDGSPHLILLVRAAKQYRWPNVAQRFLTHHRVHVNFAPHIKTWMCTRVHRVCTPSTEYWHMYTCAWRRVGRLRRQSSCEPPL